MTDQSNPYSSPKVETAIAATTDHDTFILQEAGPLLRADERVLWTAYMQKAPSLILQMLFMGLIMLLFIRHYLVAVTDQRIILFRTGSGFLRPKMQNRGVETIEWNTVTRISTGGFANNRSVDFFFADGTKRTLRTAPWVKFVGGQKDFFEFVQAFESRANEVARPAA